MPFSLLSTVSGSQQATENFISWEHPVIGPVISGSVLLAFVGGIDSQKPGVVSATLSGSNKTPFNPVPMNTVDAITGPGGISFPCGFIFYTTDPISGTGTVTGTITVNFDEHVGTMTAMSAIFVGGSGTLDGSAISSTKLTQFPDFDISNSFTTTAANSLVIDMCIGESSNHNDQNAGPGQTLFGNLFFSGPRITTSYSGVSSPGTIEMSRSQAGGPFAGVTLITFALRDV